MATPKPSITSGMDPWEKKETEQYLAVMRLIEDEVIPGLEGMRYGCSPAEKLFKTYATIGLVILFGFAIMHQVFKYMRLAHLKWLPNMDAADVPVNVKIVLNLIERELAPTLLVLTFLISVGAYYFFALLVSVGIVVLFVWLGRAYQNMN